MGREVPRLALFTSGEVLDDLGDHIACTLNHDPVARAHAKARNLVRVVQGGVTDDHTADRHRLQLRDRGQLSGAANLNVDIVERGLRALGREFVRDRPARGARHETEALLPVETIDLVHDSIDVEGEVGALLLDCSVTA